MKKTEELISTKAKTKGIAEISFSKK